MLVSLQWQCHFAQNRRTSEFDVVLARLNWLTPAKRHSSILMRFLCFSSLQALIGNQSCLQVTSDNTLSPENFAQPRPPTITNQFPFPSQYPFAWIAYVFWSHSTSWKGQCYESMFRKRAGESLDSAWKPPDSYQVLLSIQSGGFLCSLALHCGDCLFSQKPHLILDCSGCRWRHLRIPVLSSSALVRLCSQLYWQSCHGLKKEWLGGNLQPVLSWDAKSCIHSCLILFVNLLIMVCIWLCVRPRKLHLVCLWVCAPAN